MKKASQLALGCLISAVTLFFVFKDFEFAKVKESLSEMTLWPIVPFLFFVVLHYYIRCIRWKFLLPTAKERPPTMQALFDSLILGNLASCILPLRIGEFVRPLVLTRWSEYSFGTAFISVVIERFFDLSAVLITFAIVVPMLPSIDPLVSLGAYSLGGLAGALLLFLVLGTLFPVFIREMVAVVARPLPDRLAHLVKRFAGELLDGAAVIKTPGRLFAIVGLSGLVWLTAYLQFWSMLFMFPYSHSFLQGVAICIFVALAVAAPSAPGFVGVFQAGVVAACKLFSYPEAAAQVYSIVIHATTILFFVVLGFTLLFKHNLSLGELRKAAEKGQ